MEEMINDQPEEKTTFNFNSFYRWIPFLVILAANLYLFVTFPYKTFYGDSKYYWEYTDLFVVNGQFSLLNYHDVLRSYVLPLLLWLPRLFSNVIRQDNVTSFRIFSAFMSALTTTMLLPLFFEEWFDIRIKPLNRLLFGGLITFFWYGHLSYPLTDFPALAFFLMGMYLCIKGIKSSSSSPWLRSGMFVLAGILLGGATLLRLNYQYSFVAFIILALISLAITKASPGSKFLLGELLIIGICIPLSVQALINASYYNVINPFPLAKHTDKKIDVTLFALYDGLNIQRADFGGTTTARSVLLPETQGLIILDKKGITNLDNEFKMTDYLNLALSHPFDFATMCVRHLFDGLDIVYPSTYIPDVTQNQLLYRFVNYTLLFLSLSLIWRRGIRFKQDKKNLFLLFLVILPALLTIPGVVEIRYFLPIYILMYGCISFWFFTEKKHFRELLAIRPIILYACFMIVCFTFSSMLFSLRGILLF